MIASPNEEADDGDLEFLHIVGLCSVGCPYCDLDDAVDRGEDVIVVVDDEAEPIDTESNPSILSRTTRTDT